MTFRRTLLALGLLSSLSLAQKADQIKALHAKIDSIGAELKMLERILTSAGLDVEKGRKSIARQDSVYDIPVTGTPILGELNAPVTVVLFTDLQCPYCAQMAPVLREMQAQSPKHLKISFRHFPLISIHDKAMNAHMALWAAGKQGKFWEYFDKVTPLFRGLTDSALVTAAQDLGLDLAKFKADKHSSEALKAVEADMKLAEAVGVEGTPSLFLNGKPTRSPSEIKAAIEIAAAKK